MADLRPDLPAAGTAHHRAGRETRASPARTRAQSGLLPPGRTQHRHHHPVLLRQRQALYALRHVHQQLRHQPGLHPGWSRIAGRQHRLQAHVRRHRRRLPPAASPPAGGHPVRLPALRRTELDPAPLLHRPADPVRRHHRRRAPGVRLHHRHWRRQHQFPDPQGPLLPRPVRARGAPQARGQGQALPDLPAGPGQSELPPCTPLEVTTPAAPLNIVWLVSESWRADTLDAEIMPHTWAFAQNAQRFTHNYSGGNGTRVGMFTMFTGIPGSYWFPVLAERKGAPLIDVLKSQNYQMSFYTSAKFSYPEFDATIFSQVPTEQLHEIAGGAPGWEKDQQNVAHLLKFIDTRDKHRPFFTFMFFESPHARYYFPPESVIRTPYLDDINYFTLSKSELASQIHLIKNRYLNSVHHLDSQFGRVFDYLKQHDLLKNTVVLMLGDHGEEFLENGRWGHNSAFTDQQTRTPLVLWVPGMKPSVYEGMSNHMDVIPMLMPMLGVKNPQQDYTTGFNLLAGETRDHAVIAEWSSTGYIDRDAKITLPLSVVAAQHPLVTGPHDEVLSPQEQDALFARKAKNLAAMLEELGRYLKKSKSGK
ncbi:MAG: sulfatase-like hydrolase/transferase [Propionivibrio sp.]|nr:sulfatase-like hydrolase/transferase [Propionivibrio sp.]